MKVAHFGRDKNLMLQKNGKKINLKKWGLSICQQMENLAKLLDRHQQSNLFMESLTVQMEKFKNPEKTPSSKILKNLKDNLQSFHQFASQKSQQYAKEFKDTAIHKTHELMIKKAITNSIQSFNATTTEVPFNDFIKQYYEKNSQL
jgi:glutamate--cysteine ligase